MNTATATRRNFICAGVAAGVGAALSNEAKAAQGAARLPVPNGKVFEGMAGAYAAMYTPFFRDGAKAGELNEEMIEKFVEYAVKSGLTGLYLTGSTGEGFLLSREERARVYRRTVKASKGRLKLIAHVGCLSTDESCRVARLAADAGVDWVSSVAPVYFGENFEATYDHYKTISEATDLPFMIYAIRGKLNAEQSLRFFDIPKVLGMKYTGRDYYDLGSLYRRISKPAIFFAGADEQVLNALATGVFSGCIGTTDNHNPRHFVKITQLAAQGRFEEARSYQAEVCKFIEVLFTDENFSTHKSVMKYLGLDFGNARRPAGRPLTQAEYDAYMAKVEALGFMKRNGAIL